MQVTHGYLPSICHTFSPAPQVTHDISHLTCADFLRAPGVQTPLIVRFSTVSLFEVFLCYLL
jgi:hypothetical protein